MSSLDRSWAGSARRTTRQAVPTAVALALVLAAAGGCGRAAPPQDRTVLRFIAEPAQELLRPGSLLRGSEVASWPLAERHELERWEVRGADQILEINGSVLELKGRRSLVTMERKVGLDAAEVRYVELTVGTIKGISVRLDWAPAGTGFDRARRLEINSRDIPSRAVARLRFPVGAHPLWEGDIDRLRLRFAIPVKQSMRVRHLAALDAEVDAERLAAALARPWLLDLGGDARSALLAPPGLPIERPITVPPDARLSVAWAVPEALAGAVELRASFVPTAEDGRPSGEAVPLLTETPAAGRAGSWQEGQADLAPLAGRRGLLRLESAAAAEAATEALRSGAFPPAWGHPEVRTTFDADGATEPEAARPNVVLISIDTLRADRLSLYGNPRPTSPAVDAWAARGGVTFESAVAAAPWTLPGHVSLFTGVEAFRHGVNFDTAAPPGLEMLAERLRGAGYRTLAVTGGGFLHPRYGLAQGFDRFHYFPRDRGRDTTELVTGMDRALELLRSDGGGPFFLFFHTYEVHGPLRERAPYFEQLHGYRPAVGITNRRNALRPEDGYLADFGLRAIAATAGGAAPEEAELEDLDLAALARDLYDARVAYTDAQIARLLARLAELERPTVVVLTSDHGEMLGEHGLGNHAYLYDENLLVPLVIAVPGVTDRPAVAGRRIARQVRQIDVAPTLLELAGLDPGPDLDGRSLAPLLGAEPPAAAGEVPAEAWSYSPKTLHGVSLRAGGRLKYVQRTGVWPPAAGQGLLFDLRADPGEDAPVVGEHPELRRRVVETLREAYTGVLLQVANRRRGLGGEVPLRAELRGTMLDRTTVHSVDYDCGCIQQQGLDVLALEVPPGESFVLRLESATEGVIHIDPAIPGRGPRGRGSATIDLAALDRPAALSWENERWVQRTLPDARGLDEPSPDERSLDNLSTGFILWRRGPARTATAHPSDEDAALRRQLEALGYID